MTNTVNTFFYEHSQYLNDLYGIDYTEAYDPLYGWTDFTSIFVDSIMLWCAIDFHGDTAPMIKFFMGVIKASFSVAFSNDQVRMKFVRKGKWMSFDDNSEQMEMRQTWDTVGYLGINVTFHNVVFADVLHRAREALVRLHGNGVILRSIDVTIDCARISTRSIIEKYILSHKLATKSDIVNDRRYSGDNCISYVGKCPQLNNANTRTKIYNKFIQALESSQVLQRLGSRLSHLVASPDASSMEKLKRFLGTGYTRIELTVYGSTLFAPISYQEAMDVLLNDLAKCPTFKVPLYDQWHKIVEKLSQVTAIYIEETETFAYCHWWNSLTKQMQGLCREHVSKDKLECLLANFSFNDRVIHCFHLKLVADGTCYEVIKHDRYQRATGCRAMTLVPGLSNSLFPSRSRLQIKDIMFADIGLNTYQNVTIEWPFNRIERTVDRCLAPLIQVSSLTDSSFDMTPLRDALLPAALTHVNSPQVSKYIADYACLNTNTTYQVIKYGYASFRNKVYLHLVLNDGALKIRCSTELQERCETLLQGDVVFSFTVIRISKRQVYTS
jgi:hypothetical protein